MNVFSVFAVVGNKYTIDAELPPTTSITLIDKIQWLTFGCVTITAIMVIVVVHGMEKPEEEMVAKNDYAVQARMLGVYLAMNIHWIAPLI